MVVFRWIKLVKPGVKKSNQSQNCQILSHWFMMWTPASDYSPDFVTIPFNKYSPMYMAIPLLWTNQYLKNPKTEVWHPSKNKYYTKA